MKKKNEPSAITDGSSGPQRTSTSKKNLLQGNEKGKPQYAQIGFQAIRDGSLSNSALRLLVTLCAYRDNNPESERHGTCFPSQKTLAADLGKSVRWILKLLNELELKGYVTRCKRTDGKAHPKARLYHVRWSPDLGEAAKAKVRLENRCQRLIESRKERFQLSSSELGNMNDPSPLIDDMGLKVIPLSRGKVKHCSRSIRSEDHLQHELLVHTNTPINITSKNTSQEAHSTGLKKVPRISIFSPELEKIKSEIRAKGFRIDSDDTLIHFEMQLKQFGLESILEEIRVMEGEFMIDLLWIRLGKRVLKI